MRPLICIGLLCLAACQSVKTPFEPRNDGRADDPLLTPKEQQKKTRSQYALPDEELAPSTGIDRPGVHRR